MASRELNLIVRLKDEATKQLDGVQGKLQDMQPAFRKMAAVGTAGLAGISAGVWKTTQSAADAEGAWNKFSTVFGEETENMTQWVGELRDIMPSAERDIVRMSAGIGDLLKPMGYAEDEAADMTKQVLELTNKVAAFNDADPSEVLSAMESGLTGMTRPLKRFGVDIPVERLEQMAIEQGIVEDSLNELDYETRRTVRGQLMIQAAYQDSQDSIGGFEDNQDSLIRRQQELRASLSDLSVELGNVFLPLVDAIVKKIIPVIHNIRNWVEENPELVAQITMATAALFGLLAGVGLLGIALPAIITGFGLLAGPLGIVLAAFGALAAIIWTNREAIIELAEGALERLKKMWQDIQTPLRVFINVLKQLWEQAKMALMPVFESMREALKDLWEAFSELWGMVAPYIIPVMKVLAGLLAGTVYLAIIGIITVITKLIEWFAKALTFVIEFYTGLVKRSQEGLGKIKGVFNGFMDFISDFFDGFMDIFKTSIDWVMDNTIGKLLDGFDRVISMARRAADAVGRVGGGAASRARGAASSIRSRIPGLAEGGIVTSPTLAMIGEGGESEAVIPLSKLNGTGGGTTVNITVRGDVSGRDLVDKVKKAIAKETNREIRL